MFNNNDWNVIATSIWTNAVGRVGQILIERGVMLLV